MRMTLPSLTSTMQALAPQGAPRKLMSRTMVLSPDCSVGC